MKNIYAFYNVFSWWVVIWVFLYVVQVCPVEPYIGVLLTVIFDIFSITLKKGIIPKLRTPKQILFLNFRILVVGLVHWIPMLTLPAIITKDSVIVLIGAGFLYLLVLYLQGLTVFDVYDIKYILTQQIKTFEEWAKLRFHNYFVTSIFLFIIFYNAYNLVRRPFKNSIVHTFLKR